ncbi:peptidoglycan-binding domain-containing protein [Pontimicrobium sp. MEBiC06410]
MSVQTFTISDAVLRRACEYNSFSIEGRENEMIIFAIRGALPAAPNVSLMDYSEHMKFKTSHLLQRVNINYYYPRCLIGQWLPAERKVAVFLSSTVPNLKNAQRNRKRKHQFNSMQPGFYNYKKGQHPRNNSGFQPHRALRLNGLITLRRANYTISNGQPVINYGPSADISVGNPGDNIHCARNNPKTTKVKAIKNDPYSTSFCISDYYSSYGCQVVTGCPPQYIPRGYTNGDWNAWDKFIKNVYDDKAENQDDFKYILLNSCDLYNISKATTSNPAFIKVRHGSTGHLVEKLQTGLKRMRSSQTGNPYYSGRVDGDFGKGTAEALIRYQKENCNGNAFGFAGQNTFRALGVSI